MRRLSTLKPTRRRLQVVDAASRRQHAYEVRGPASARQRACIDLTSLSCAVSALPQRLPTSRVDAQQLANDGHHGAARRAPGPAQGFPVPSSKSQGPPDASRSRPGGRTDCGGPLPSSCRQNPSEAQLTCLPEFRRHLQDFPYDTEFVIEQTPDTGYGYASPSKTRLAHPGDGRLPFVARKTD